MAVHRAETYREAAKEHALLARRLHDEWHEYAAAHYWAGLAVECMLRAYRLRHSPGFDSRHDVLGLVHEARFYASLTDELQQQASAAIGEVAMRWRNDHRYRSKRMLLRWLRDEALDRRVRGDRLKFSSRQVVDAALVVVQIGDRAWLSTPL